MPTLRIGHPYSARRTWPEVAQYQFRAAQHELVIFLRSPRPEEVAAVRHCLAQLRLLLDDEMPRLDEDVDRHLWALEEMFGE